MFDEISDQLQRAQSSDVAHLREQIATLQARNEAQDRALAECRELIDRYADDKAILREQVAALTARAEEDKQSYQREIQRWYGKLAAADAERDEARRQMAAVKAWAEEAHENTAFEVLTRLAAGKVLQLLSPAAPVTPTPESTMQRKCSLCTHTEDRHKEGFCSACFDAGTSEWRSLAPHAFVAVVHIQPAPESKQSVSLPRWKCRQCGCLWRDNLDGTVSLFDISQRSCRNCEMSPTSDACEVAWFKAHAEPMCQPSQPDAELVRLARALKGKVESGALSIHAQRDSRDMNAWLGLCAHLATLPEVP